MLDVFKTDAFGTVSLTDAFIKAPYKPGRIGALGMFRESGIRTTTAVIEWKDGHLSLIQTTPRGGPGSTTSNKKRTAVAVVVPHLERERTILADELQNVRAFGSEDATPAYQAIVSEKLEELRADIEVTKEHMRAHAIQGIVKDADGSTLLNLFTTFDVSQSTGYVTPNPTTDEYGALRGEVVTMQRTVEGVLGAVPVSGYRAFCGKTFFDAMRADVSIAKTLRYADPASLLSQDGRSFSFGGVTWEEYIGATGGTPFFADSEAYLVPNADIFRTYNAPADFIEAVNTIGLPVYAKMIDDAELNRWTKIHTQANPLVLCLRPDAVVKVGLSS